MCAGSGLSVPAVGTESPVFEHLCVLGPSAKPASCRSSEEFAAGSVLQTTLFPHNKEAVKETRSKQSFVPGSELRPEAGWALGG